MSSVKKLLERVVSTPAINASGKNDFEIHSLTSHKHLHFYLWSIKSFIWASKLSPTIIIHDDGTLTKIDIKFLKSHLRGVKIITKKEANKQIDPQLKRYPACLKYRSKEPFAKKIIDVLLVAKTKKVMILDSDVLFFKKPTEIIRWAKDNKARNLFNWDPFDTEVSMHQKLKKNLDLEYSTGYNSGLQCLTRDVFNIKFLENYLSYCYKHESFDWWVIEQRSMSLLAYNYDSDLCKPLPRERYFFQNKRNVFYKNRSIETFPDSLVAKHYSRYARTLFATEGVRKLLERKHE